MPTKTAEPKEAPDPVVPEEPKTDWEEEAKEIQPEEESQEDPPYEDPTAVPSAEADPLALILGRLEAGFDLKFAQLERRMELLALKAVEIAMPQAVQAATNAAAMAAANKPPMTMRANVHDNFISSPGKVAHLGHYRCERMKAVKIQEYDMERMKLYESGALEWPRDKVGRRLSLQGLCKVDGSYIPALDGHIYPITVNHVECLEWYKLLPRELGGMPDLYKDDSIEPFRCTVCQNSPDIWPTREGWAAHMLHVHGEVVAQAA